MNFPVQGGLVHVRTPTFRRPQQLRRALQSLQAQTHENWVCDVFDNDPEGCAETVVAELADTRIRYQKNHEPLPPWQNIDRCFARANPHDASYFCYLEDDDQILPHYMGENIRALQDNGVEILQRNQLIEFDAGTPEARVCDAGTLDQRFFERVYQPAHFRLSLMCGIGLSSGGVFWSRHARSDLELSVPCSVVLQEYLRTLAVVEPIHVALEPLAIWAKNDLRTNRYWGEHQSWVRREMRLKSSISALARMVWSATPLELRVAFLDDPAFRIARAERLRGLLRAGVETPIGKGVRAWGAVGEWTRGALIRGLARPDPALKHLFDERGLSPTGTGRETPGEDDNVAIQELWKCNRRARVTRRGD